MNARNMNNDEVMTINMKRSTARWIVYIFEGGHEPDAVRRNDQNEAKDTVSAMLKEALNETCECLPAAPACRHWRNGERCA